MNVPSDPRNWEAGTSSSLFAQLTENELEDCMNSGIKNIEICLFGKWLTETGEEKETYCHLLAGKAKEIGVRIWSVHLPFGHAWDISNPDKARREEILKKNMEMLQLGALFNPVCAVIHPSYEPIDPQKREAHIQACRESLDILSRCAAFMGIKLAVECLPRTCLGSSISEMKQLLDGNQMLGICCDTNHLLGDTTEEFIRQLGDRIVTIHASDYDRIDERHWMPGRGVNNWKDIIGNLARAGYRGPFMFELSQKNAESPICPSDLKKCWEGLLNGVRQCGCDRSQDIVGANP